MGEHVKSVIHNTIGSLLSTALVYGGIVVILWFKGLALHWALLVTAGFMLSLAIAANFISLIVVRHRKSQSSEAESESQAIERIGNQNDQLQGELHLAEKEIATLKGEKGRLSREIAKLEKSLGTSQREVADAKTQLETRETQLVTANMERNAFDEQLQQALRDLKQANLRARQEESQRDIWMKNANDAERKVADLGWLEGRMKQQAEKLDTWVRIKQANRVKLQLTNTRMVTIALWVKNNSIFTVTFDFRFLTGCLQFKGVSLHDPIGLPNRSKLIEDLEPGVSLEIILEQPLLRTEAERIFDACQNGDPNGIFSLADLHIPIRVRNIPQEEVKVATAAAELKIHPEIEFMAVSEFPCDEK